MRCWSISCFLCIQCVVGSLYVFFVLGEIVLIPCFCLFALDACFDSFYVFFVFDALLMHNLRIMFFRELLIHVTFLFVRDAFALQFIFLLLLICF